MKLKIGDTVPAFSLEDQDGNVISSSDFQGQKVLLYFYPKADTPGCTIQSCAVRDALPRLGELGLAAFGISPDAAEDQKKFDAKYSLGFPLLADQDHSAAEAFGVWGEKSMLGKTYKGIIRSSFLVGENGKLLGVWYKVSPKDTVPRALELLEA